MAMDQAVSLPSSSPFAAPNFVCSATYSNNTKHYINPEDWLKCLEEDIGAEMTVKSTTENGQETDSTQTDDVHRKEVVLQLPDTYSMFSAKYQEPGNGSPGRHENTAPSSGGGRSPRFKRDTVIANGHSYAAKRKKPTGANKTTQKEVLNFHPQKNETKRSENIESENNDDGPTNFALLESFEVAKILCSLPEIIAERETIRLWTNNNNINDTVHSPEEKALPTTLPNRPVTDRLPSSSEDHGTGRFPKLDDTLFNRVVDMIRYYEGNYDEPNEPEDYPDWVDAVKHSRHGVDIDSMTRVTYNKEGGLALQHGRKGKRKIKKKTVFDI